MKKALTPLDIVLICLWGILFFNAAKIQNDGLLFDWPIQVHLTLTGALLGFRIIYRRFFAKVND